MRSQCLQRASSPAESASHRNCRYIAPNRLRGHKEDFMVSGVHTCSTGGRVEGEWWTRQG